MDSTMKCWCWQGEGLKEPQHLVLKEKAIPALEPHQVLIQNTYIGLNPIDWKLIERGNDAWLDDHVLGVDGVGLILAVGSDMTHLRVGQRVCYHTDLRYDGSFSTHTLVNGWMLMHLPDKISDVTASAFPCPTLTAYQAFNKISGSIAGQHVLVNGAGGSVGFMLTQLLLRANAKVYITSSPTHHPDFYSRGVLHAYNYNDPLWKAKLVEHLGANTLYAAFDTVSPSSAAQLAPLLGYYGHLVPIQGQVNSELLGDAPLSCISIHQVALGAIHRFGSEKQLKQLMLSGEKLLSEIASAELDLREVVVESFDKLPYHLAKMKKLASHVKYVIKV